MVHFKQSVVDGPSSRGFESRDSIKIVSVSAGGHHSVFLSDQGHVYTCGSGNNGQLGLKSTSNKFEPVLVYNLTNK